MNKLKIYKTIISMQYKIPVQIENEDKIFLNLSLRQLTIIMVGGGFGYTIFKSLEPNVGASVALFPAIIVTGLAVVIALFRHSEMTFVPFLLNMIRLNLNVGNRLWSKGVDSYTSLEVGYIRALEEIQSNGETKNHLRAFENVEESLGKL
ncbi:MAG: PrgI family protein [Candidatus Gracilibacteria bacterium]|nr:PrgI family protein [Candidatus Gracilibacteria bacterium]